MKFVALLLITVVAVASAAKEPAWYGSWFASDTCAGAPDWAFKYGTDCTIVGSSSSTTYCEDGKYKSSTCLTSTDCETDCVTAEYPLANCTGMAGTGMQFGCQSLIKGTGAQYVKISTFSDTECATALSTELYMLAGKCIPNSEGFKLECGSNIAWKSCVEGSASINLETNKCVTQAIGGDVAGASYKYTCVAGAAAIVPTLLLVFAVLALLL